jgi:hypothetical protein
MQSSSVYGAGASDTAADRRDSREYNHAATAVELRTGMNSFLYVDSLGREIPVYYYLPASFRMQPVDPAHTTRNPVEVEKVDVDGEEVSSIPDAADLAEEAAENESDVEDVEADVTAATPAPSSNQECAAKEADEEDDISNEEFMKFERELFTSQDIIFVMHGVLRNAKEYCMQWVTHANRFNILVVCPEFNAKHFPEMWDYNLGAMRKGKSEETWSFMAIEKIFDIFNASGVSRHGYHMYGHSADSQFAHRFLMFMPKHCRALNIISANAGWYTMPVFDFPFNFPYSLRRAPCPVNERQLRLAFSRSHCILLGQEDKAMVFLRRSVL